MSQIWVLRRRSYIKITMVRLSRTRQRIVGLLLTGMILALAGGVRADSPTQHTYSWEGTRTDLSPIVVQPYLLPTTTDPAHANFLRKMNLENGAQVHGTHWITSSDVASRDLFILDITQSLEGGFDSVNIYDKGLLSWGIMQWAARYGSLQQSLVFVKRRLWAERRKNLWDKTFVANGMDVDANGFIIYGKPLKTPADMRLAFRGSLKVGNFDPKLVNHWAITMARAGRQPAIAALQVEYASHIVDAVLKRRLPNLPYHLPGRNGLTVADLAGNDPYTEALIFALWTNNPRHSFEYIAEAAHAARAVSVSSNPSLWAPGAFSDALMRLCRSSRFGNWSQRGAMIEAREQAMRSAGSKSLTPFEQKYQVVLAMRKVRRQTELASRHRPVLRSAKPPVDRQAQGLPPSAPLPPLHGTLPVAGEISHARR